MPPIRATYKLGKPYLILAAVLATMVAFAVPLYFWNKTPGLDWTYFNPMSLVVRFSVLFYHTFPLHNPWVCGGMDILANPQTRVLSPMSLLDITLPPEWANLVAFILNTILGFVGMYCLLDFLRISRKNALLASFVFICGTYFALHTAEGHATFGPMILIPWVLYFFIQWTNPRYFFFLGLLEVYFVHCGANYTFVFSLLLMGSYAAFFPKTLLDVRRLTRRTVLLNLAVLVSSILLALVKIIPMLSLYAQRSPDLGFTAVPMNQAAQLLWDPTFGPQTDIPGLPYRAHEFGCFLSWFGTLLIFFSFLRKDFFKQNYKYLLLLLFWLVTGFGWGGDYNPWYVFQKIPLVNNAHVQSRLLLLMFLVFVILMARALDRLRIAPDQWLIVAGLIFVEAAVVRNYPYKQVFEYWSADAPTTQLITNPIISKNEGQGWEMKHYFSGNSSKACYEPFVPRGLSDADEPDWEQILVLKKGVGVADLIGYTPGKIRIHYASVENLFLQLNVNYLGGWSITEGPGSVSSTPSGLIAIRTEPGEGDIILTYRPKYLPWIWACGLTGLFVFSFLARTLSAKAELGEISIPSSSERVQATV